MDRIWKVPKPDQILRAKKHKICCLSTCHKHQQCWFSILFQLYHILFESILLDSLKKALWFNMNNNNNKSGYALRSFKIIWYVLIQQIYSEHTCGMCYNGIDVCMYSFVCYSSYVLPHITLTNTNLIRTLTFTLK